MDGKKKEFRWEFVGQGTELEVEQQEKIEKS